MDRSIARMIRKYTAVFEQKADCWIGWIEELPGANTQGSTLEEARDNLKEAVRLVLDANRQLAVDHSGQGAVVKEEMLVSV
jgi:predicted RNase H-like HicB family nuclease